MSLELAVARQQTQMRAMEHAVHERNGWSLEVGGLRVPARRVLRDNSVLFSAMLPELPFRSAPTDVSLLLHGEVILMAPIELDGERRVDFHLRLSNPVGV